MKLKGSDKLDLEKYELITDLAAAKEDYEFAELSQNEFEELNNVERRLNQGKDREIIILAYEKKSSNSPK